MCLLKQTEDYEAEPVKSSSMPFNFLTETTSPKLISEMGCCFVEMEKWVGAVSKI